MKKYGFTAYEALALGPHIVLKEERKDYKLEIRLAVFVLLFCAVATIITYWPKPQVADAEQTASYQQRALIMHATPAQIAVGLNATCIQTIADHKLINEPLAPATKKLCNI